MINRRKPPIEDRFWELVSVAGEDECWNWKGYRTPKGYGQLPVAHKHNFAHRLAFELKHRPLNPGEVVCHKCDNPSCCNPKHLFAGTQLDNIRDRDIKGRSAKGAKNANFGKVGILHPGYGHVVTEEHKKAISIAQTKRHASNREKCKNV